MRLVILSGHELKASGAADAAVLFEEEVFCCGPKLGAGEVDVSVEHQADDVFAEEAFLDDAAQGPPVPCA